MEIVVTLYEKWMKPQVAKLFSAQYGVSADSFGKLIDNFYDHPYQEKKCIRIVALEGEKVIGFQSFFYWPYFYNEQKFNSYQSGNSLVHPEYRGRGIFQKLLNYLDLHRKTLDIDLLIGFPINISKGSLKRNGWQNIFDLDWKVKLINSFALFYRNETKRLEEHFTNKENDFSEFLPDQFRLSREQDFLAWRNEYTNGALYYFVHIEGKEKLEFTLKYVRRNNYLKELCIGNIRSTNYENAFVKKAFDELKVVAKKTKCITFLSIAYNPNSTIRLERTLNDSGYRTIKNRVFFQLKTFTNEHEFMKKENWTIYRSDVDTW